MPLDARAHHDTVEVFRQQEIAAPTYYYIRCSRLPQNLGNLNRLKFAFEFYVTTTLGVDAKCIMLFQTIVPKIVNP